MSRFLNTITLHRLDVVLSLRTHFQSGWYLLKKLVFSSFCPRYSSDASTPWLTWTHVCCHYPDRFGIYLEFFLCKKDRVLLYDPLVYGVIHCPSKHTNVCSPFVGNTSPNVYLVSMLRTTLSRCFLLYIPGFLKNMDSSSWAHHSLLLFRQWKSHSWSLLCRQQLSNSTAISHFWLRCIRRIIWCCIL